MNASTKKLFVLAIIVWNANDYLNDRNTDSHNIDVYLYATRKDAEKKAKEVDSNNEIYNEGYIYTCELTKDEILEISGFGSIEDFEIALAEPYSTNPNIMNFGESEKKHLANFIMENTIDNESIECANYDFNKSQEGAILIFWSWVTHIGYARKCLKIRRADSNDTEAILTKQDKTFVTQCDILLTAEEVAAADNIQDAISERLADGAWKRTNPVFAEKLAKDFLFNTTPVIGAAKIQNRQH